MNNISAGKQMKPILDRTKRWLIERCGSVRAAALATDSLQPPERMASPNLTILLNAKPNTNIYLQQVLVLANVMRIPAAALLLDTDDHEAAKQAIHLANLSLQIPAARRAEMIESAEAAVRRGGSGSSRS